MALNASVNRDGASPVGLMCELLEEPALTKIAEARPEFGWVTTSDKTGDRQTAYQIRVTGRAGALWDSGQVASGQSINVDYAGEPLTPDTSYSWKVKTWTALAGEGGWSAAQAFTTAEVLQPYATTRYPLLETPMVPASINKKGEHHYVADFGTVAFGYLTLAFDAPEAGSMQVHLAERGDTNGVNKNPGGTVRYRMMTKRFEKGMNTLSVHSDPDSRNTEEQAIAIPKALGVIMPFRYVELENCPVELKASMIRQVAVHYPFNDQAAAFESSNDILDQIWELCRYSMKATSFCGVYVDGDRERIPYEADAYINQLSHYAVDREFSLARYSHEYLLKHPTWPTEWKQHSVMMAWADYMYTGNSESLAQCYDQLKAEKTLEQRARDDGLLNTKGMRDIVDWPGGERDGYRFKEVNTVVNAFHYENLKQMRLFAEVLGKEDDARDYEKRAQKFYQVFNDKLFDSTRGVYVDGEGTDHASLHANMMPLAFGLVPDDRLERVADFVVSRGMACSVYAAQYLMEGLYNAGRADEAFDLLTSEDIRSWYNMIRVGATITLEAWDNTFKPNQDWNHAWGAVPGNIIPRYLLGVRPLEAGFGKALIRPMPGPLERAASTIPTIRGPIKVTLANKPGEPFELAVTIPVTMTARVEIPLPGGEGEVMVNGKPATSRTVNGFAVIDGVGSGTHTFRTTGAVMARMKKVASEHETQGR